jgi:hypothetical protein
MNQNKTFSGELVLLVLFLIREGVFQKKLSILFASPFFIFADRLYPFFCQWHGFMSFKIESNHNRLADTFYFIRFCVDTRWISESFGAYLRNSSLYADMIGCEYLFDKIRFDVDNDNPDLFPIYSGITEAKYSVFPKS